MPDAGSSWAGVTLFPSLSSTHPLTQNQLSEIGQKKKKRKEKEKLRNRKERKNKERKGKVREITRKEQEKRNLLNKITA